MANLLSIFVFPLLLQYCRIDALHFYWDHPVLAQNQLFLVMPYLYEKILMLLLYYFWIRSYDL